MIEFSADKERKKLQRIVKNIPADKKKLVAGLIEDASFMAEQLAELRAYIVEHGWSEEYQNGANQHGKKTSTEADAYVKVQKLYAATIKQLSDYVAGEEKAAPAADELIDFIVQRK